MGSHLISYLAQIMFAHYQHYFIRFTKEPTQYNYYDSPFVNALFHYIEKHNDRLLHRVKQHMMVSDYRESPIDNRDDLIHVSTTVLQNIKTDFITFFQNHIYTDVKPYFTRLSMKYHLPFDIDKTILVHLRLDDVAHYPDYDGRWCCEYYKHKIQQNEPCVLEFFDVMNHQAPLSKPKLDRVLQKAMSDFPDYKVVLLTSPGSDTTRFGYDYDVIKSDDASADLYYLTMCKVAVLSRSTFALSAMFFNPEKTKTYVPLWGHFVACGLDTIYDKNDMSKMEYFT
jgi:hypothetical protein